MAKKYKNVGSSSFTGGNADMQIYKKGVFIGGLCGGIFGLVLGKKIILSTIVGALMAGWMSYTLNKNENSKTKAFNKTSKTKFKKPNTESDIPSDSDDNDYDNNSEI